MGIKERRERERERRRQQIMVAAKKVFTNKGFNRATMEAIAQEAELSAGTLYLYFESKEDLRVSLTLSILQFLNMSLDDLIKEEDADPLEKLDKLIEIIYDVYKFDPVNIINMFHLQSSETLKNISPLLLMEIKMLSKKTMEAIAGIFKDGIKKGVFLDRHPVALADILWSIFSGVVLWESSKNIINDNKDYLKQSLGMAFNIFRDGICLEKTEHQRADFA
jgi:AcrR family transcriptional regulator